jgi:hypothetical protein
MDCSYTREQAETWITRAQACDFHWPGTKNARGSGTTPRELRGTARRSGRRPHSLRL